MSQNCISIVRFSSLHSMLITAIKISHLKHNNKTYPLNKDKVVTYNCYFSWRFIFIGINTCVFLLFYYCLCWQIKQADLLPVANAVPLMLCNVVQVAIVPAKCLEWRVKVLGLNSLSAKLNWIRFMHIPRDTWSVLGNLVVWEHLGKLHVGLGMTVHFKRYKRMVKCDPHSRLGILLLLNPSPRYCNFKSWV